MKSKGMDGRILLGTILMIGMMIVMVIGNDIMACCFYLDFVNVRNFN